MRCGDWINRGDQLMVLSIYWCYDIFHPKIYYCMIDGAIILCECDLELVTAKVCNVKESVA